jgi:hypothetical protein
MQPQDNSRFQQISVNKLTYELLTNELTDVKRENERLKSYLKTLGWNGDMSLIPDLFIEQPRRPIVSISPSPSSSEKQPMPKRPMPVEQQPTRPGDVPERNKFPHPPAPVEQQPKPFASTAKSDGKAKSPSIFDYCTCGFQELGDPIPAKYGKGWFDAHGLACGKLVGECNNFKTSLPTGICQRRTSIGKELLAVCAVKTGGGKFCDSCQRDMQITRGM